MNEAQDNGKVESQIQNVNPEPEMPALTEGRRRLLKAITLGGAATAVPIAEKWAKPVVESVLLPSHAQTTDQAAENNVAAPGCQQLAGGDDFVVPDGITSIDVSISGAAGNDGSLAPNGGNGTFGIGGAGALVTATIAVTPGESLSLADVAGGAGGTGGTDNRGDGGDGGASATISRGATLLLVAGGGGGGGGANTRTNEAAGAANNGNGGNGGDSNTSGSASEDGDAGGAVGFGGEQSQNDATHDGGDGTAIGAFVSAGGGAAGGGAAADGGGGGGGGGGTSGDTGDASVSGTNVSEGDNDVDSTLYVICWGGATP